MRNQWRFCYFVPLRRFIAVGLLTIAPLAVPLAAIASEPYPLPQITAQAEAAPTTQQRLDACVKNQAETLPNPFTDVPRRHWAFKVVLTMHYCGAYRQATPPRLIEQSTKKPSPGSG
jgi:hypothetical protein